MGTESDKATDSVPNSALEVRRGILPHLASTMSVAAQTSGPFFPERPGCTRFDTEHDNGHTVSFIMVSAQSRGHGVARVREAGSPCLLIPRAARSRFIRPAFLVAGPAAPNRAAHHRTEETS